MFFARRFATALLPNVFGRLVDGRAKHAINGGGSFALHVRQQVGIDIQRKADAGVAQPPLHDLGMDVRGK